MPNDDPLHVALRIIQSGRFLSSEEMCGAVEVIMSGNASDGLIGAFLGILATRIPTGEELFGATLVMKRHAKKINFSDPASLLDTCGTGGAPKTFNVSTAASIVAAACGVRVAKHGNRSRTGRGSAEVLERLGINIHATTKQQKMCLDGVGICFCFAPNHHLAIAHVMPVRKELDFPTLFNLLGPLTNPCSAGRQLLGVWDDVYVEPVARALHEGGTKKSVVVHSQDGLDEISISAPTRLVFVDRGGLTEGVIDPESLGLRRWDLKEVTAPDLETATEFIHSCLIDRRDGAPRDMILINSAVALFISDCVQSISDGVELARDVIDTGKTSDLINNWASISNAQ